MLKPKSSGVWEYVQLKKDKTIDYLIWPCAPEACGFFTRMGTYKVDGNNLTITLTHEQPDVGYKEKLSKPVVMKFTIVSEKQISYKGNKYNWQSNFN